MKLTRGAFRFLGDLAPFDLALLLYNLTHDLCRKVRFSQRFYLKDVVTLAQFDDMLRSTSSIHT